MGAVLGLVPSGAKLAVGGLLIAGLVAGYFGWRYHQRVLGRQEVIAADAKAVAEQAVRDRDLSRQLVADLRTAITAREATAAPVRKVIYVTPPTCPRDAALDAAAVWVRGALAPQAGRPATRP